MFTIKDIIEILKDNPKDTLKEFLGAISVVIGGFVLGVVMILFL